MQKRIRRLQTIKLREVAKENQRARIEQEGISSGELNMGWPLNEAGGYDWERPVHHVNV